MKEDSIFSLDADLNNLWVWCLSKASHTNTKWDFIVKGKGKIYVELLPGQFVCGRHSMAKSLGTSSNPSTTWKRLKMLESHGFVSIKSDKKYSVVTILNWNSYKDTKCLKEQVSKQDTELEREQETRQQHDTKKNVKNVDNVKNVKKNRIYSKFIPPTIDEIKSYITEKNLTVDGDVFYQYFTEGNWHDSRGNKVNNWKLKLLTWNKGNFNEHNRGQREVIGKTEAPEGKYHGIGEDFTFE